MRDAVLHMCIIPPLNNALCINPEYDTWIMSQTIYLAATQKKLIPCARSVESEFMELIVTVARRVYCFHASDPLSRPHPESLLPPKAPPISAPDVPIFRFTIPQSDPCSPVHLRADPKSRVNSDELKPCAALLFASIASSRESTLDT